MSENRRSATLGLAVTLVAILGGAPTPGFMQAGGASSTASSENRVVRLRFPVRRDTVVSGARGEREANLGGSRHLKTKGIVELTLFDLELERLRGVVPVKPVLHVRSASEDPQLRVSVSTVSSEWVEGESSSYRQAVGAASFNWAASGERPWAWAGSDVTAVVNGLGNTLWAFADPTPRDAQGWQRIAIEPRVFAARIAGLSGGFALTDDVGSEYARVGDQLEYRVFPNRLFWSTEAGAERAPYVTVGLGPVDREPPGAVELTPSDRTPLAPGTARLSLLTPADKGVAGTLGFEARFARAAPFDWATAEPLPRYLIPFAGAPGERVTLEVRDLEIDPGGSVEVGVRAVDAAGNLGPISVAPVLLASAWPRVELVPDRAPVPAVDESQPLPEIGGREVFVIDPLDKVRPGDGAMIPERPAAYKRRNHLWDAAGSTVRLSVARNEFVAFQVVLAEGRDEVVADVRFKGGCRPEVELLRYVAIPSRDGPLPDPLVPLAASIPSNADAEARYRSLLVDLWVPHDCPPGEQRGVLTLSAEGQALEIAIELEVWNFVLPDHLSFVPQMNSYGLPPPPEDRAYYRQAHRHRTCLNLVPYNWRGEVFKGYKPDRRGSWAAWDVRFGPLLDGSAFADLPRSGVPVDAFYLPFNENWPASIAEGFLGGYWAESALSEEYRERFTDGVRSYVEHLNTSGWTDTMFEFYLNNKLYHRREEWNRSSAYWVFDEPINTQDFWALRWYASAFHQALAAAGVGGGGVQLGFRADISRPEWQRDLLDGLLDVNVVGLGFAPYLRTVLDRRDRNGEVLYNYGTSNRVENANVQPAAWVLWAWSVGADGVLPWKTVGRESSWGKASPLALFYPGAAGEAHPSIRLKSYRRGQQDVEYLTMLAAASGVPRRALGEIVLELASLDAVATQTGTADAGRLDFDGADAVRLWRLRERVGSTLDRLAPPAKRRWVERRTPLREPARITSPRILRVD